MKRKSILILCLGILLGVVVFGSLPRTPYDRLRFYAYMNFAHTHHKDTTLKCFLESHDLYKRLSTALTILNLDPQDTGKAFPGAYGCLDEYRTFDFHSFKHLYRISVSPGSISLITRFKHTDLEELREEEYEERCEDDILYGYDALLAREKALQFMDAIGPVLKRMPNGVHVGPLAERQRRSIWSMEWPLLFGDALCGVVIVDVSLNTGSICKYFYKEPMIPKRTTITIDEQAAIAIGDAWAKEKGFGQRMSSSLEVCLPNNFWEVASTYEVRTKYVATLAWSLCYECERRGPVHIAIDAGTGKGVGWPGDLRRERPPRDW